MVAGERGERHRLCLGMADPDGFLYLRSYSERLLDAKVEDVGIDPMIRLIGGGR